MTVRLFPCNILTCMLQMAVLGLVLFTSVHGVPIYSGTSKGNKGTHTIQSLTNSNVNSNAHMNFIQRKVRSENVPSTPNKTMHEVISDELPPDSNTTAFNVNISYSYKLDARRMSMGKSRNNTIVKPERTKASNIVGGQDADRGEYPWQIILRYGPDLICGGTIINEYTILTAAHCVLPDIKQRINKYTVIAGDHNFDKTESREQRRAVETVLMSYPGKAIRILYDLPQHPNYQPTTDDNDVAVLHLTKPFTYTKWVKPVILAGKSDEDTCSQKGRYVVTGAGISQEYPLYTLPSKLQEVEVELLSLKDCRKIAKKQYNQRFTSRMLCSYVLFKGPCNGDSGGPIGCFDRKEFIQVGVVSYGSTFCYEGFNGYARIYKLRSWILNNIFSP